MKHLKKYAITLLILALGLLGATGAEGANSMAPYLSAPIFMTNAVPPNVLIIFDNSGSMNAMAYWEEEVLHDDLTPGEYDINHTQFTLRPYQGLLRLFCCRHYGKQGLVLLLQQQVLKGPERSVGGKFSQLAHHAAGRYRSQSLGGRPGHLPYWWR
jgi:hypothetical protein